jgi:hypothetical protein
LCLVTILYALAFNDMGGKSQIKSAIKFATMWELFRLWLGAVCRIFCTRQSLMLENLALLWSAKTQDGSFSNQCNIVTLRGSQGWGSFSRFGILLIAKRFSPYRILAKYRDTSATRPSPSCRNISATTVRSGGLVSPLWQTFCAFSVSSQRPRAAHWRKS